MSTKETERSDGMLYKSVTYYIADAITPPLFGKRNECENWKKKICMMRESVRLCVNKKNVSMGMRYDYLWDCIKEKKKQMT